MLVGPGEQSPAPLIISAQLPPPHGAARLVAVQRAASVAPRLDQELVQKPIAQERVLTPASLIGARGGSPGVYGRVVSEGV